MYLSYFSLLLYAGCFRLDNLSYMLHCSTLEGLAGVNDAEKITVMYIQGLRSYDVKKEYLNKVPTIKRLFLWRAEKIEADALRDLQNLIIFKCFHCRTKKLQSKL